MLGRNGKLNDSKKGQSLPAGVAAMPLLADAELTGMGGNHLVGFVLRIGQSSHFGSFTATCPFSAASTQSAILPRRTARPLRPGP